MLPLLERARTGLLAVALATTMISSEASGQRFGRGFGAACRFSWDAQNYFISPFFRGILGYDGRVTFARIKYQGAYECGGEGPGWSLDYPRTDVHFMRIMRAITSTRPSCIGPSAARWDRVMPINRSHTASRSSAPTRER